MWICLYRGTDEDIVERVLLKCVLVVKDGWCYGRLPSEALQLLWGTTKNRKNTELKRKGIIFKDLLGRLFENRQPLWFATDGEIMVEQLYWTDMDKMKEQMARYKNKLRKVFAEK